MLSLPLTTAKKTILILLTFTLPKKTILILLTFTRQSKGAWPGKYAGICAP